MGEARSCVYFSVIFLCFSLVAGKPFFGFLFCDLLCDDDDDVTTTSTSTEDPWDIILCEGCGPRRRPTLPPLTTPNPMGANPINFMIPGSSSPMNLTWFPGSNGFSVNMLPWNQGWNSPPPQVLATMTPAGFNAVTAPAVTAAAPTNPAPAATTTTAPTG